AAPNTSFSANSPSRVNESLSSLPPRLQNLTSSLVSADYAPSTASSPCAAYAELSIETDGANDLIPTSESGLNGLHPSPAPIPYPHRAIMSGDGEHHRSSSPLKRRASSMDPEVGGSAADQSA